MLDGDEAGKSASEKIKGFLDENFMFNKVVSLPQGKDPGDLSTKSIETLRGKLYGESSYS